MFAIKPALALLIIGTSSLTPLAYSGNSKHPGGAVGSQIATTKEEGDNVQSELFQISSNEALFTNSRSLKNESSLEVVKFDGDYTLISGEVANEKQAGLPIRDHLQSMADATDQLRVKTKDIPKALSRDERRFVENLISIISGAIWTEVPLEDLWIDELRLTAPAGKLSSSKPYSSVTTKAANISEAHLKLDKALWSREKRATNWRELPFTLKEGVSEMSNLVRLFVSRDWDGDTQVLAPLQFRLRTEGGQRPGEKVSHIIRLVRVDGENRYYCDIYFNSKFGQNMIRSNYVIDTRVGERLNSHFQANGSQGTFAEHIGGDSVFARKWGRVYNSVDEEFANLFASTSGRAARLWKWFEVLAKCVASEACNASFQSQSHLDVSWSQISALDIDALADITYQERHPLSKLYREVSLELENRKIDFS
ncbi:hypothetical protein [Candidatus Mycoplasma haematominutum]|uniref:Uncharacterized protein n=1 Tax=Candidatus Mycoplasma haematominutum 'Birmingham 1' TaxID=1116213 RepID=G8C2P8_9MOLU|nr:hypothetical protein [Candidatus Mycoplasma haematominutum]CCE66596.1 hypothetical protein MHM_00780 [Candidatus Mycoplasma haematominutum 'Birmingham 1']